VKRCLWNNDVSDDLVCAITQRTFHWKPIQNCCEVIELLDNGAHARCTSSSLMQLGAT